MPSETFSLVLLKQLNYPEACQYIDKYFIQLSDGYHAVLKDGQYHKIDPKLLKSIYFDRMEKKLSEYYFKHKNKSLITMQFAYEERPINGSIYVLKCNKTGLQYIGSTTKSLQTRLSEHISFHTCNNRKLKQPLTSIQIIAGNDYSIELLESDTYFNKTEMRKRERFYMDTMSCVNKNRPYRNRSEKHKYKNNETPPVESPIEPVIEPSVDPETLVV